MRGRWGPEGPPDEAYSRVTNPERFAPLHDFAALTLERLVATFDVSSSMSDEVGSLLGLGPEDVARPAVRLTPADPQAAPITFGFTTFPGLIVQFGRTHLEAFPSCGCDACDETAEGEAARLAEHIDAVTAGRYREAFSLPAKGDGSAEHEFLFAHGGRSARGGQFRRALAERLVGSGPLDVTLDWRPWPRRRGG